MLLSYSYTQPYYVYVENLEYNVVPGTLTLNFDSSASSDPNDYLCIAEGGELDNQTNIRFSLYDQTLAIDGSSSVLTLPVTMSGNCLIYVYYQGSLLNFRIRANIDFSRETPAIFEGLAYSASP